eukprot:511028_1
MPPYSYYTFCCSDSDKVVKILAQLRKQQIDHREDWKFNFSTGASYYQVQKKHSPTNVKHEWANVSAEQHLRIMNQSNSDRVVIFLDPPTFGNLYIADQHVVNSLNEDLKLARLSQFRPGEIQLFHQDSLSTGKRFVIFYCYDSNMVIDRLAQLRIKQQIDVQHWKIKFTSDDKYQFAKKGVVALEEKRWSDVCSAQTTNYTATNVTTTHGTATSGTATSDTA